MIRLSSSFSAQIAAVRMISVGSSSVIDETLLDVLRKDGRQDGLRSGHGGGRLEMLVEPNGYQQNTNKSKLTTEETLENQNFDPTMTLLQLQQTVAQNCSIQDVKVET